MKNENRRFVLMVALFVGLLPLECLGTCPSLELVTPSFGQLLLLNRTTGEVVEDITVTTSRPVTYEEKTRVEYRCARGYQVIDSVSNMTLNQSAAVATCTEDTTWSLLNVECRIQDCGSPPSVANAGTPSFSTTTIASTATYSCNTGYSFSSSDTDRDKAVCNEARTWTHLPTCTTTPAIGNFEIVVIVASALGGFTLIFLATTIFFCCWVIRLKHRYSRSGVEEAEVTLARAQGVFTLANPLTIVKDEESVGKPLYLTPDEMNALEQNRKH